MVMEPDVWYLLESFLLIIALPWTLLTVEFSQFRNTEKLMDLPAHSLHPTWIAKNLFFYINFFFVSSRQPHSLKTKQKHSIRFIARVLVYSHFLRLHRFLETWSPRDLENPDDGAGSIFCYGERGQKPPWGEKGWLTLLVLPSTFGNRIYGGEKTFAGIMYSTCTSHDKYSVCNCIALHAPLPLKLQPMGLMWTMENWELIRVGQGER